LEIKISPFSQLNALKQKDYLPKIIDWHHQQWQNLHENFQPQQRLTKYINEYCGDDLPMMIVASEKDLLGTVAIQAIDINAEDINKKKNLWVSMLYVDKKQRNKGVGRALLQYAIQKMKNKEYQYMFLYTHEQSQFYKNAGWKKIHSPTHENSNFDVFRYSLK